MTALFTVTAVKTSNLLTIIIQEMYTQNGGSRILKNISKYVPPLNSVTVQRTTPFSGP
jgi:hypothetical protein